MNARRVPLADVPNAANSPLRAVAAANAKRPRTHNKEERDFAAAQPPTKRQFVETDETQARRDAVLRRSGSGTGKETALQKKLEAARVKTQAAKTAITEAREEKAIKQQTRDNADHIREWQRHYTKAFPQYTLYLDNIPDDVKPLVTRDIHALGAVQSYPLT